MAPDFPKRPFPLGIRAVLLTAIIVAGLLSAHALGLFKSGAGPSNAGLRVALDFFSHAFSPSWHSEAPPPWGSRSLIPGVLEAIHQTIIFAAAGLGLALVLGTVLGFLGSTAWWSGETEARRGVLGRILSRAVMPTVYAATRVVIALLRSVHELIWAVLFLAALGRSDFAAVVAIAIPISGTLAKIFSELIDEAPRDAALVLRAAGAGPVQVFSIGLLPRALPDMAANTLYQFECALRSSTVLGFFGFPTLGYAISASFENLYYGEVWTYLYALLALIVAVEWWSGAIRRRMV
jgi:phosphonate transport system permease protein